MPTGLHWLAVPPELNMNIGIISQEIAGYVYDRDLRGRDLQVIQKDRCDPLVHQNAPVLWVVAELYDVKVAIVALDQVGLRPAAHFSDQAFGQYGHRKTRKKFEDSGFLIWLFAPNGGRGTIISPDDRSAKSFADPPGDGKRFLPRRRCSRPEFETGPRHPN